MNAAVDKAGSEKRDVVTLYHKIVASGPSGGLETAAATFNDTIDYGASLGMKLMTLRELTSRV